MASTLLELSDLISTSVKTIDSRCTALSGTYPDLDKPQNAPENERLVHDSEIVKAASIIVSAATQLIANVKYPTRTLFDTSLAHLSSAALAVVAETSIAEIVREAGSQGCHVDDIAKRNGMEPLNIARVLRVLATQHIFREVSPDVFAHNRISTLLDTGKDYETIRAAPEDKHEGAVGYSSVIQLNTDETFKAAAYINEVIINPDRSEDELDTPLSKAFGTHIDLFSWYELPENKVRFKRFGVAMDAWRRISPQGTVLQGFEWSSLEKNALIVDVGGGIGSISLEIAQSNPDLRFLIQDTSAVVQEGIKHWERELPDALPQGRVSFAAHDFFTPQPVHNADIFLARFICHDWSDAYTLKFLKHLRDSAQSTTKLVLMENCIRFVCGEDETYRHVPGAVPTKRPPRPLLPNMGAVDLSSYLLDMQMMSLLRGCERTFPHFWKLLQKAGWQIEVVYSLPGSSIAQMVARPI
ncbi:hypothetical protein GYMLUDRAFT_265869 [Collybiopsis luxurians FD-317 M1]|uniref:O-methyltransferase domain-containing protein n=1 Tax=Collybiopsis luxurians FD-317 M1 TaxID=944289 RepID=A0A0D0C970_9AGAR|nr:hypothetical protein GYMLUDRAFT_265869 [Collybiopsis luxurians FD-317 M1]